MSPADGPRRRRPPEGSARRRPTDGGRPSQERPSGGRTAAGRTAGGRPSGGRPAGATARRRPPAAASGRRPTRSSAARRRRPRRLSAVTLPRLPALDGLRVIAAVGVVLYHVMGSMLGTNPTVGVIIPSAAFLFFVISGFVIYRPFVAAHVAGNQAPSTGAFYRSRLLRVLPLWALAVTVYLLVDGTERLDGVGDWVATYLLLQYLVADVRYAVIGPAWALSVEWIFYLTAPLLALAVRAGRARLSPRTEPLVAEAAALGVLFVLAWVVAPARPAVALVAGMALAVVDVDRRRRRANPRWLRPFVANPLLTLGLTAASWVALAHYPYPEGLSVQWVERDAGVLALWTATALIWFVPVAFGAPSREPQRTLGSPWAVRLSLLTFGVYLWHDLVLRRSVELLGRDGSFAAVLWLTFLGSVALATATYAAVERPGRWLIARRPWSASSLPATAVDVAVDAEADRTAVEDGPVDDAHHGAEGDEDDDDHDGGGEGPDPRPAPSLRSAP